MDARALIDEVRGTFVADATISPSRAIVYVRNLDSFATVLNSYVGVGMFSKVERETIGRFESFGGLLLTIQPEVGDSVSYGGIMWRVVRHSKIGQLYNVVCENKRHNGRPSA